MPLRAGGLRQRAPPDADSLIADHRAAEGDETTSSPVWRTSRRACIPASAVFIRSTTSSY